MRDVVGHRAHPLPRGIIHAGSSATDIVHVAARAVGQNPNKRRTLYIGYDQWLDRDAKHGKIVGRNLARWQPAHVVKSVVREQGDGPAVRGLHRNKINHRVGRTRRLEPIRMISLFGTTRSWSPNGLVSVLPSLSSVRRLKRYGGTRAAPQPMRASYRLFNARRTPSAIRRARDF